MAHGDGRPPLSAFLALGALLVAVLGVLYVSNQKEPLVINGHAYTGAEREAIEAQNAEVQKQATSAAANKEERRKRLLAGKSDSFAQAEKWLKDGRFGPALEKFREVQEVDPAYPGLQKDLDAAERGKKADDAVAARQRARTEAASAVERRRALGKTMRENLLDQGFDIKVRVSGKDADRIAFTFVLFNDVWSHKFQKQGLIDELCRGGFTRIDMSDGYNWGRYWKC